MKKILIFEPNSDQALAIAKYIKKYSDFHITGVSEKKTFSSKKNFDEIIIKKFSDVEIDRYDYVFPMGANSTYEIVNKYKELYYENEISFSHLNLIAFDKPKMLDIADSLNIPIPETFYKKENITKFPVFYKENFENGRGVRGVANNADEIPHCKKLIYQEFIDTPFTYGVGFLAKEGKIITSVQHKEILSYPKEGGSAVVIESFYDERLVRYTQKLLEKIKYNGWGLAEFKYCNYRKDFVFMEINAKFWASVGFALHNNNVFLKKLLNIDYSSGKTRRMIFINRLLNYNISDIVKSFKFVGWGKWVADGSFVFRLIKAAVPSFIMNLLKKIST